jgi:large subunit ribosomal protein L13
MKTAKLKLADIQKKWLIVDAANQPLGRVASQIAYMLRGKHKANYTPYMDCGDNVVVVNASKVVLTGRKWTDKVYYHHTNYIGGIKAVVAKDLVENHPERLIETAVKGMLPKNKLGHAIMGNLKVYADDQHPHAAQKPEGAMARTTGKGGEK